MDQTEQPAILGPEIGPAAEVINPGAASPVFLVCEHASAFIPASLNDLGLAAEDRYSHAVWDIGAAELSRKLSTRLDATLVLGCISRLVYDCNRDPSAPDAIPALTETIGIPGNADLSPGERGARAAQVYDPFTNALTAALDARATDPVFVTIHSFAPIWHGAARETEIGLLHDADNSLALDMLNFADPSLKTELNEPYSAKDGVTHTLAKHATKRRLVSVMIEVRNDLLGNATGIDRIADVLSKMVEGALDQSQRAAAC